MLYPVDQLANLAKRTLNTLTRIEFTDTVATRFSGSALYTCAGVTFTDPFHTDLAFGTRKTTAGIGHASTIHAGLEQLAAHLCTAWNTLTITTELTRLTLS